MDNHSSHMEPEKQDAEREIEAKAIAAQQKADLDHLLKNTHPSLRDIVSLGDSSNGATQTLSDYAAQIFKGQIELLQSELAAALDELAVLRNDFESLRLQVVPSATPETPIEELPPVAVMPVPTVAPVPVVEMPAPTVAPVLEIKEEIPAPTVTQAPQVQQ
jgi:hypothetical protein